MEEKQYLEKINQLESKIDKLSSKLEEKISKLENLFIYDFLLFFNLKHEYYATFELFWQIYPEYQDISVYVDNYMNKLLKFITENIQSTDKSYILTIIDKLSKANVPSIEQIVYEVNNNLNNNKSKKAISSVNKDQIVKILYLYLKDFKCKDSNIQYLVKKILQLNGINHELSDSYKNNNI